MKRIVSAVVLALLLLLVSPVLAAGLGISPPSVEFDVPAEGSAEVEFLAYDFTGTLEISLEDIPLRVEPNTVPVTAKKEGTRVVLTFYGDESLGSQTYEGKIRFLAMTGSTVAMGIKVPATINHIATGEPLPQTPVPSEQQTPTQESPTAPPGLPPARSGTTEWPIIPVAAIAAGTAIVITLIIVLARRRQY